MARIGFKKAKAVSVADRADAIINKQGGLGHEITDPTQKLLAMTAYLGEPGFFPEKAAPSPAGMDYDPTVLDERGREIYDTAVKVLQGDNPEDVLVIAHWARQKLNMRLFPQILFVAAARHLKVQNVQNPIIRYMPKTAHRPDDLLQVHALYNAMFGKKADGGVYPKATLPPRLKRAMAQTFAGYDVYKLVKYNRPQNHPNYEDVLRSLRGGRTMPKSKMRKGGQKHNGNEVGWPLSKALRDYLIDGKMNEAVPTKIKARHDFMRLPNDAKIEEIRAHAKAAGLTWEDMVSKFGSKSETEARRREIWSAAASQMGALALFKNLRNLLDAGVPNLAKRTAKVYEPEFVKSSRMLPFRFYTAYDALAKAPGLPAVERKKVQENISKALDTAADHNVPEFPGVTAIFVDTSGSMSWGALSKNGSVTPAQMASLMAGILNRRCETALVYAFATSIGEVNCSKGDSVLSVMDKILRVPNGGGTNFHLCFDVLVKKRIKVDRIVILSDNECSGGYGRSCGQFAKVYAQGNKGVFIHAVDLQAHGQSAIHTDMDRYNLVGGFSESIFTTLAQYEVGYGQTKTERTRKVTAVEKNVLPTIEALRAEFTVPVATPGAAVEG